MLNKQQRILIELDALIDTRLGTIKRFWPRRINNESLEEYHNRDHIRIWDIFHIPESEYLEKYKARDIDTLAYSFGTQLSVVLRALITTSIMKAEANPHIGQVSVTLNLSPYVMEPDMQLAFLKILDELLLVHDVKVGKELKTAVDFIDMSVLSAGAVRKKFEGMIIYDLVEWLSTTNTLTAKEPSPTLTVYFAALLYEDDDEARRKITEDNVNPFKTVRKALAGHFLADALDAELFNIVKT